MSTVLDLRRSVRVIAAEDSPKGTHETVNVAASSAGDTHHSLKEHVQISAASYNAQPSHVKNQIDVLIVSGGTFKHLRTVYINGYSGPS